MGLFEHVMVGLFNEFEKTPQSALMNDRARAGFEDMRRRREFEKMHPGWQDTAKNFNNNNSDGNIAGKVLFGAAAIGGAMLLKHIFSSDDKKENKVPDQNEMNQPTK